MSDEKKGEVNHARKRIWGETDVGMPRLVSKERAAELQAIMDEEDRARAEKKAEKPPEE